MKSFAPKQLLRELARAIETEVGISISEEGFEEVFLGDYGYWHYYSFHFVEDINPMIAGTIASVAWEDFFRGKYHRQARAGVWMSRYEYDRETRQNVLVDGNHFFTLTSVALRKTRFAFDQLGIKIELMNREESGRYNTVNGIEFELRIEDDWTWIEDETETQPTRVRKGEWERAEDETVAQPTRVRKGPPKSGKHYSVSNIVPL